jgi:6 kDa early secretory antigenic target
MTQFQVDSEQVLAANSAIQLTIGRVQGDIEALHSQLQSLQDSWRGLAANQFQDLAMRWHTTASTVQFQLGELGKALAMAASQYEEIESANVRLFAG